MLLHVQVRNKLAQLELSNQAVIDYEHQREKKFGKIPSPFYIRFPFKLLCWTLDVFYDGRPIQRCVFGDRRHAVRMTCCSPRLHIHGL